MKSKSSLWSVRSVVHAVWTPATFPISSTLLIFLLTGPQTSHPSVFSGLTKCSSSAFITSQVLYPLLQESPPRSPISKIALWYQLSLSTLLSFYTLWGNCVLPHLPSLSVAEELRTGDAGTTTKQPNLSSVLSSGSHHLREGGGQSKGI